MDPRHSAILIAICAAAVPTGAAAAQDLQPISDRRVRVEIPGVSILPPQGEGWVLSPVSPQEGIPANTLIRFVQIVRDLPLVRPEDARQVMAGVAVSESGLATSMAPADFLQGFTGGDPKRLIGEMLTERQRLIGFEAELDESLGATCVKYSRLTEITGQFSAFPGLVGTSSTHGLYCRHPRWPAYHVDVTFQQNYAKGQPPLSLDVESDFFLRSVVFTPSQPAAPLGLRSHLMAAETAFQERRWSEAETSFRAALKEAELLGPQDLVVAMVLYYLASTQQNVGRVTDAEPLFRRALGIFDVQSGVDDPEIAHVHGLTLNDLGVIYATRASSASSPSSRQLQLEEAERLYLRALAIREKSDPGQVGRSLNNLTQLYVDAGRWTEATTWAERALSFYERERGPEDEAVVYQLDRLASILRKAGREADARELETRAQAIRGKAPARP